MATTRRALVVTIGLSDLVAKEGQIIAKTLEELVDLLGRERWRDPVVLCFALRL